MKRICCLILALLCLLLVGCEGWGQGSHVSVTPHHEENSKVNPDEISAQTIWQLRSALENLVESGAESGLIYVPDYDQESVEEDVAVAVRSVAKKNPIGAYAVEEIRYELGSSSGKSAVAVQINYVHDRSEIRLIKTCNGVVEAVTAIEEALDGCENSLVLRIDRYRQTDFIQMIQDYAAENPDKVMELPQVTVGIYPESGNEDRVVELKFTYQTSRDILRNMQHQVRPVFEAAVLYVSGDGEEHEKLSQLYSFLMERFNYRMDTSITPAYSLLRHGVGDSKAFATVFAAMCRDAGLECLVVSGTRDGEARYWNIVREGESYYHVDLIACNEINTFQELGDSEMIGYVWDYSAYPLCQSYVQQEDPDDVVEPSETEEISE